MSRLRMLEPPWRSGIVWSWTGTRRSRVRPLLTRSVYTVSYLNIGCLGVVLTDSDLSLEFLMGRALDNAMLNVEQKDIATSKLYTL